MCGRRQFQALGLHSALFLAISFIFISVNATPGDPVQPYDFLYKEGIDSYLKEDWELCVKNLEMAVEDWHWSKDNTASCRRKCSEEGRKDELFSAKLTEDDKFFERAIRNTLCVVNCKKTAFGSRMDRIVESKVEDDFNMRKPYDYLQLCYYRLGMVKKAADAAATVLAVQPQHEVMTNNLQYYLAEGDIQAETVINMELKEYGKEYIMGVVAYNDNDYKATVAHMEKSITLFYDAYEDCRSLCENPFDQGWHPDFLSSVANHYTFTLRCKRRCIWQLSNLYGEIDDDFYPSYFNYLQYSYFQVGETDKACEAAESAIFFNPEDEVQIRNKQFYLNEAGVTEDFFTPRKDVVAFKGREDFEEKLMEFIETNFSSEEDDEFLDEDNVNDEKTDISGISGIELSVSNSSLLIDALSSENTDHAEL